MRWTVGRVRGWVVVWSLCLLTLVSGCGGCSRERDKNKNFDRPKEQGIPAEKK
ncbi:MAG TPA: hypothetical protein VLM40_06115 [Gemmata sp.]|nr:hypothetical protein [Gemmata sp.]